MNIDDPKFTAHLLGEFEDLTPEERAEIAALIAADPAAAAEADETLALAARLRAELPGEAAATLADEQRAAVLQALEPAVPARSKILRFPSRAIILSAAAACVVVAASMAVFFPAMQAEKDAARKSIATMTGVPATPTFTVGNENELVAGTAVNAPLPPAPEMPQPQFTAGATTSLAAPELQTASVAPASKDAASMPFAGTITVGDSKPVASTDPAAMPTPSENSLAFQPTDGLALNDLPVAGEKLKQKALRGLAPAPTSSPVGEVTKNLVMGGITRTDRLTASTNSGTVTVTGGKTEANVQTSTLSLAKGVASTAPAAAPASQLSRSNSYTGTTAVNGGSLQTKSDTRLAIRDFETGVDQFSESLSDASKSRRMALDESAGAERYDAIIDNAFLAVREQPLSTFSIDVDTASYANVRRFLTAQQLPPPNAVRIEELLNYFTYDYPQPQGDAPFSATMEVASCPWMPEHRLVRIGLKGKEMSREDRPASNLVFLIDVSGSMRPENKLPLLKRSLGLLVDQLGPDDTVSIAVYAGASGVVLEPTHNKAEIRTALDRLEAGGSTNGASGIKLAYRLAEGSFLKKGTNRVILATDGDFNVGVTNQTELVELIEKKAKSGVFLTVLGFGMGNLKDSTLEKLADKGNGNYAYIDSLLEGKKVLVEQMNGTLFTIAKDVKIQVEFNPAQVASYRLIGYENRMLKKEDFNDDTKDAGEIGSGHTVTALYEVVPPGIAESKIAKVDELKYQPATKVGKIIVDLADGRTIEKERGDLQDVDKLASNIHPSSVATKEMLTLKLRYKAPDGDTSKLLEFPLTDSGAGLEKSSVDFRFAAAVASYGLLLRNSEYKGEANWNATHELATEGKGPDLTGYRTEFISLVEKARALAR